MNKECSNCKYYRIEFGGTCSNPYFDTMIDPERVRDEYTTVYSDFCCKYWEPKEDNND